MCSSQCKIVLYFTCDHTKIIFSFVAVTTHKNKFSMFFSGIKKVFDSNKYPLYTMYKYPTMIFLSNLITLYMNLTMSFGVNN